MDRGRSKCSVLRYRLQGSRWSSCRRNGWVPPCLASMLVALDPGIPPASPRMRFAARGKAAARWRLDGKLLSVGSQANGRHKSVVLDWMPWPGQHTLELPDRRGAVLDQVRFAVRGAVLRPLALSGQKQPSR